MLGHDLVGDEPDHVRLRPVLPRDPEPLGSDGLDADGVLHPLGHLGARDLLDRPSALEDELRLEALQVGQEQDVGLVARREGAEVVEAVPECGVQRRKDERVLGGGPGRDSIAHHPVDVPVLGDVVGVLVIGAESDPLRPELLDEREQRTQVPRHRRLADE